MKTLFALVLVVGCSKTNPYYCADHPDNNCTLDGAVANDVPTGCNTSTDCPTDLPVCEARQCVQCTAAMPAACVDETPLCGSDNTCHGCTMDSDCTSQVCMPDGSCADGSSVLYAAANGGNSATCAATDKCSIGQAVTMIDATHTTIHLDAGMYSLGGTLAPAATATFVGRGATLVKTSGTHGPVLATSAGNTLTIDFVTVEGGDDNNSGHGVSCQNATVAVHNATLQTNSAFGVGAVGCTVAISQSMFTGNTGGGISITGSGSTFDVTNNVIYRNGNTSLANAGGVYINQVPAGSHRFQFNTIVDNQAAPGSANAGGVYCDLSGYAAGNNIIARNTVNQVATAQTFGACTYPTSLVQNDTSGIAFAHADTAPYSFDLLTGSIAIDQALTLSTIDVDFGGTFRPQGPQKDIGASEYKQ